MLKITQAKPNPSGKDRYQHSNNIPISQLVAEWVDFQNVGTEAYPLEGIKLQHIAYNFQSPNGYWDDVMSFSGTLLVGEIVRIHSGGEIDNLTSIDRNGANHHLFTGRNMYSWNNDRQDSPRIILVQNGNILEIDRADYSANPPEGKILKRIGDKLV